MAEPGDNLTYLDAWAVARTTPERPRFKPGRLFKYCRDVLGRPVEEQPHAEICADIDEALGDCQFKGDQKRLVAIGVPRGCWKTSIAAESAPMMILDENPNARILIDCYRHSQAKDRCAADRRKIEEIRPDWKPLARELPWSDDRIVITARTDTALREPSIGTSGIDRSQTGAHYDCIIVDDVVNDQNINTDEVRTKVYNHILDLLPILEPGGTIIMLFTTWHVDDAYARLRKIDDKRLLDGKKPFWKWLIRSAYNKDGSLYFPGYTKPDGEFQPTLSQENLDDLLAQLGPSKFAAQYLLSPIAAEDQTFSHEAMRVANFVFECTSDSDGVVIPRHAIRSDGSTLQITHTQIPVAVTMSWDPAGRKGKQRHDEHAFIVNGTDSTDRWWILAAAGHRGVPTQIIDEACNYVLRYKPHTVSCEDVNSSAIWLDLLEAELEKRKIPVPIMHAYEPGTTPKEVRIELLQPRWMRGGIVLQPTQQKLIHQISHFSPANDLAHDDLLDALAQHMEIAYPAATEERQANNPIDEEWVARQARLDAERQTAATGRSANHWAV